MIPGEIIVDSFAGGGGASQGILWALGRLAPRELYRAQGFPDSYMIDVEYRGKPMTKTAQVRMVGNSVCPPLAEAIVRANLAADLAERAA